MKELLKLARRAIEDFLNERKTEAGPEIVEKFGEEQACFVTITEKGMLRGCIGSLLPSQPLYEDVIENAVHAGFHDYRFNPLSEKELEKIKIEVSVLSVPKKLEYKDAEDLLRKINNKMGIVLKNKGCSATFLPQVWEQIPDKIEFLEELSMKAGLDKDDWKTAKVEFYMVKKVKEGALQNLT